MRNAVPALERAGDQPPKALVVDDDPAVREMLRISLSLEGWHVLEAATGDEAIEQWGTLTPDIVLLDNHMRGMSGLECAAALRKRSPDARIIMFTGFLDVPTMDEARRLRILPLRKEDQRRLQGVLSVLATQLREDRTAVTS